MCLHEKMKEMIMKLTLILVNIHVSQVITVLEASQVELLAITIELHVISHTAYVIESEIMDIIFDDERHHYHMSIIWAESLQTLHRM